MIMAPSPNWPALCQRRVNVDFCSSGVGLVTTGTGDSRREVAGLIRPATMRATNAHATANNDRIVESMMDDNTDNTVNNSVPLTSSPSLSSSESWPAPEVQTAGSNGNGAVDDVAVLRRRLRRERIAIPLVTLSWLIILTVVVSSVIRIERWEVAPGEALTVSDRIDVNAKEGGEKAPERFKPKNRIRFVTAFAGQLTALDAFVGWIDPHVQVDTFVEHFGEQDPADQRQIAFQSMFGAQQVAEYVAFSRLGYDATFNQGAAVVEEPLCLENPDPLSACKVLNVGDTITSLDGKPVDKLTDISPIMAARAPGDVVDITVQPRDGSKKQNKKVKLIANPDDATQTLVGFTPADTRTVDLPFEVTIATSDIGGPSAGLAFTLALLDELSPGELMGKRKVAATGTINEDGEVGAIGALIQKAIAVRDSGATVFLVPKDQTEDEIKAAQKAAGSEVRIIAVGTLDEALHVLDELGGDPLPRINT